MSECGPAFRDIPISDRCNAHDRSFTQIISPIDRVTTNDVTPAAFLTSSEEFTLDKSKVFQITEETLVREIARNA
jgi:hypothetical protein